MRCSSFGKAEEAVRRLVALMLALTLVVTPFTAGAVTHPALRTIDAEAPTSFLNIRALLSGTVMSSRLEHAYLQDGGVAAVDLLAKRPFATGPAPGPAEVVLPYPGKRTPKNVGELLEGDRLSVLEEVRLMGMTDEPEPATEILIRFEDRRGFVKAKGPTLRTTVADLTSRPPGPPPGPRASGAPVPRKGGMVFLSGVKVFPSPEAALLAGGKLTECAATQGELCIRARDGVTDVRTGLLLDRVFEEIWKHVYDDNLTSLYLSIDPTRESLRSAMSKFPADRLKSSTNNNRIVVYPPKLRTEETGTILYKADVLFKSAGLGFDVFKGSAHTLPGSSSHGRLVNAIVESKAFPEDDGKGGPAHRYCRFYWGSEPAGMRIEANRILFDGLGVSAHSEAMVIRDGNLQPYPGGRWCSGGKQIAKELTARLELIRAGKTPSAASAPFDVLPRLVDVSQKLALLVWAKNADVSDELLRTRLPAPSDLVTPVPEWTSGIRSQTSPRLRLDLRNEWEPKLRIYAEDPDDADASAAVFQSVIDRYYKAWEEKEAHLGRRLTPEEGKIWLIDRERALRSAVSTTEPTWEPSLEWEPRAGKFTVRHDAIARHSIPVVAHGGVLLRMSESNAPDAPLVSPGGGRVFLADGGALHFWAKHPDADDIDAEHLELHGMRIVSRQAHNGRIRFLVQATGRRALIRGTHETRLAKKFTTEWIRRLPLDSGAEISTFYSQGDAALEARNATFATLRSSSAEGRGLVDAMRIQVFRVSSGALLVEVNASSVEAVFDKRWNDIEKGKDVLGMIQHVADLSRFGFTKKAAKRLEIALDWMSDDAGADLEDKVMEAAVGLLLASADGDERLRYAAAAAETTEDLNDLDSYRGGSRRLDKTKTAKALLNTMAATVEKLPVDVRGDARDALIEYYKQLATQPNPKAIRNLVAREIKAQSKLSNSERLLRDGTDQGRV